MAIDQKRLVKTIDKLRKLLKGKTSPLTPEEVHDLRTRVRRFEASTKALHLAGEKNEKSVLSNLQRIRKQAGKVRDMDVLTSYMLGLQFDDHRDCAVSLVEYLGMERYRRAKKLSQTMEEYGRQARKKLKKSSARFERLQLPDAQSESQQAAAGTALRQSADLAVPRKLNHANLHSYRLKVKGLRYVLQTAEGNGNERFVTELGATKDAIGEWHDWEELISIAHDLLGDSPGCPVLQKLRQISHDKYAIALATTEKMRTEFVRGRGRNRRSSKRQTPSSDRALEAVAAIAS